MVPVTRRWTREEVLALPDDGNRYELIDGELLVSPAPGLPHQVAVAVWYELIRPYVRAHRLGFVAMAPADLDLGSGQLSQPDLFVVPLVEGKRPREWSDCGIPLLVVEVLSPATARFDRITKRRRYQRSGIPVYWIVDLDARVVEEWRPGDERPAVLDASLTWRPDPAVPPLEIDLPRLFGEVWDDA